MQKKWYFGTLLIILAVLGVVNQQQISVPNQEIVLQFADVAVRSHDAQKALSIVKEELQELGAENIRVIEGDDGYLKITYFSATDVAAIKKILSKESNLKIDEVSNQESKPFQFPFEDNPISYNLDIYEIQNKSDVDWDFNGTFVLELKPKSDRFFNPNVLASINNSDAKDKDTNVKVTLRVQKHIAIAINTTSHNIPEVRAGPNC